MKIKTIVPGFAAVLIATLSPDLRAQSWQTVLEFSSPSRSAANSLACDTAGDVFSGGAFADQAGASHGAVLRTDTTESDWTISDDTNPSPSQYSSLVHGIGFDINGNLYSAGTLSPDCTTLIVRGRPQTVCPASWWYVRKSSDLGLSWSTVDLFQYSSGVAAQARGVVGDGSGNVFAFSEVLDAKSLLHWVIRRSTSGNSGSWTTVDDLLNATTRNMAFVSGAGLFAVGFTAETRSLSAGWLVRRSLDRGSTWSTVDLYQLAPGKQNNYQDAAALGIASDARGTIYVVGSVHLASNNYLNQWLIRSSADSGSTWTTANSFSYLPGKASSAWGAGRDASGTIVAVGRGTDAQGVFHWLVRRPDAQGLWQTIDDFQLAPGKSAEAWSVATDADGNLLVAGHAYDQSGTERWIVRRLNP